MEHTDFLEMRGISKAYKGSPALRAVDFSAARGEVHAIVGENGAGKSTLIKILSGALERDSGEIRLDGAPVELGEPFRAHQLGIYAVYQEFSLVPHLSITENILLGQMPMRKLNGWVDWPKAYLEAQELLEGIGFHGVEVRTPVSRLSVAQQQMVEIAKAMAAKLRILILDEPSAVLSQEELKRLFALMLELKNQSMLILYISHRLAEVFDIADRITVLKDGELVGTVHTKDVDEGHLIKMMVGRTMNEIYPPRRIQPGQEVLAVKHLSRVGSFADTTFSLARGEILGLFGLVGSGRTSLARAIFGAEPPTAGEIRLNGQAFDPKSPQAAVETGIAYLTEDRKRNGLVMSCSIRDNVSLASLPHLSHWGFLNGRQQNEQVQAKVRELDIRPPQVERLVRQLSGGNQQKVALAKWLMVKARVLILDEPTRGVDVASKVEIYETMRDLTVHGMGILLISSEMLEILGMSDRILVMREGRLVGELSKEQASEERLLALAAGVSQEAEDSNAATIRR